MKCITKWINWLTVYRIRKVLGVESTLNDENLNVSKMVKDRLIAETDAATRACIQASEDAESCAESTEASNKEIL